MATEKSRKKNKFKIYERSTSTVRDKYLQDPAFTDDVRHLAIPARRNSGPESEANRMFGKKSKSSKSNSKEDNSSHYSLRMERRKKVNNQANNYSAEYLCKNSSSSESIDNIISLYKMKPRKGVSLDRNIQSVEVEQKLPLPVAKPKRSSWFLRDKSREKQSNKNDKFNKRSSLDFTLTYDTKPTEKTRSRMKTIQRQNAADYSTTNLTDSSTNTAQEELLEMPTKKSNLSKFQIGKRFLKGEIGIKSFNYYLLKEGLRKNNSVKQQKPDSMSIKPRLMSRSEENIYEEIFFNNRDERTLPPSKLPPALPPFNVNKQTSQAQKLDKSSNKQQSEDDGGGGENCMNCEICLKEAQEQPNCKNNNCDKCTDSHKQPKSMTNSMTSSKSSDGGYGKISRKIDDKAIYEFFQQQQQGQTVLQFQSYNPNNPNVYKIETTPVAFDYNPIEDQIYELAKKQKHQQQQQQQEHQQHHRHSKNKPHQHNTGDGKIMAKSSSSSDSIKGHYHHHNHRHRQQHEQQLQQPSQSNEFYTRPNYHYPSSEKQLRKHQSNSMYKTDSSNSIRSETSLNKIYNSKNSSQQSNNSNKSNHNRVVSGGCSGGEQQQPLRQTHDNMSDSSLGDSLFSGDANKRYFGSSESCKFNYECRRCSLETEKCSFSDTCRYECNLKNCDCSSSYFSSDFDDTNIYNTTNTNRTMKSHKNKSKAQNANENFYEQKTNRYAEDFIKHVSNVKRRSQNVPFDENNVLTNSQLIAPSIYEVPKSNKRLDTEPMRAEIDINEFDCSAGNEDNVDARITIDNTLGANKMLTHVENKQSQVNKHHTTKYRKTGTVPKVLNEKIHSMPLSIFSNETKVNNPRSIHKNETETKIKDSQKNLTSDDEILLILKLRDEANVNDKINTKQINVKREDLHEFKKSELTITTTANDNEDDVFLESKHKSQEKDANENQIDKPHSKTTSNEHITDTKSALKHIDNKSGLATSPLNTLKVPMVKETIDESLTKQATKPDEKKASNNNKSNVIGGEDDSDDDVFIDEHKAKKSTEKSVKATIVKETENDKVVTQATVSCDVTSSVTQQNDTASTCGVTKSKTTMPPPKTQNTNSRELTAAGETAVRDQNTNPLEESAKRNNNVPVIKSCLQQKSLDEHPDFNNFPLPEIPVKKKQLNKGKSLSKDNLLAVSNSARQQSKWKQLSDKDNIKKMHYRNASNETKPTYLFGDNNSNVKSKDGVFSNRSGWLQANQRFEKNSEARKENINKLKAANSKIEELISRNEARRGNTQLSNSKDDNVTILKIDPQHHNDRPGFLPVKSNLSRDPPPPTPILSPPPAFQDHKTRAAMKSGARIQLSVTDSDNKTTTPTIGKGMVFSRSFEYDNRKTAEFNENFSKSFDFDFQLNKQQSGINKNFLSRYGKSTTFASLTGVSPNYLTKKEKPPDTSPSNSMTSIFPKVISGKNLKLGNPNYYNPNYKSVEDNRSRRSQFTRPGMENVPYRGSIDTTMSINNRLASCDSGARSDFSNDDLDDDPADDDDDQSSSLALSYKSTATSYKEPVKNSRNITKTNLNQPQSQFKKTRTMTPDTSFDDYDLLSVNKQNNKKQRSLTPEKRSITPELLHKNSKTSTSQTSLMSRQSSGSRNSTLERQLKRYEDGKISRSSSSSSSNADADNKNRRAHRPPFKSTFGDYRIRRSRSLQLSERSPNRSQHPQKVTVRIGNTPIPTTTTTTNTTKHRDKTDYAQSKKTTLNAPSKYNQQSLRNSDNSLSNSGQAKSFDLLDFNEKQVINYGFEFDSKSKSFDDDYCYNTKITRNNTNNTNRNVFSGNRAFSQDRVLLNPQVQNTSISLKNSPRNYGSRLYDHEVIYDVARRAATRSPIMNFNRNPVNNPTLARERSPIGRRSNKHPRDYYKKQSSTNSFLNPKTNTPNRSPNRSPTDSDDSINESVNKVLKDKSLVAEYLFGLKNKQLQQQQANANRSGNSSGTPSSGSCCTSSSCEYWPQCGNSNPVKYVTADDPIVIIPNNGNKINIVNESDSSGKNSNNIKVSVTTTSLNSYGYNPSSKSKATTVMVNSYKPTTTTMHSLANSKRLSNSSIIFLGDCEMPITKSANKGNDSGSVSVSRTGINCEKLDNNMQKLQINNKSSNGDLKQYFSTNQQTRAQGNQGKGKYFTPIFTSTSASKRYFSRLKSRSLPKSFMRFSNLSSGANELSSAMFSPHLPLQMRAVSSPSLTDNPIEIPSTNVSPKYSTKPEPNGNVQQEINEKNYTASSGSVLQKFKKTLSHFKGGKTNSQVQENIDTNNEPKHHRFGPLVWRTSKERRKTKSYRRDKCNSGDSGIQVELENDENLSENIQHSMDISPQSNVKVRRANSAKVSTTTNAQFKLQNYSSTKNEPYNKSIASSITSKRSLSQPSDLDVIICETKMMNNLDNIKHIDDEGDDEDATDTDSLASNHGDDIDDECQHLNGAVYAEVLYQFQSGGPQELSLEQGALVEVLRRESGPWWWGRIKYDAVISGTDAVEIHQGWFPKDFVKIISTFTTNKSLKSHLRDHDIRNCDISNNLATLPPPASSAAPTISSSQSNSELMRDNIIKELLETEINYVKLLNSLCEGFIKEMKEHPDVFPLESICLIFSNMEQIYRFQQTFLEALRLAIPNGRIGEVFLEFQSAFMVYSQYCNSYPRALMELENISGNKEANSILENCRISQNLPELPLSAHLLAPIQRICRYPLHLSEMVKHSRTRKEILLKLDVHQLSNKDLETIDCKEIFEMSLNAMKRVTEMVNEGKRHSEYLSRMQSRLESFQGPSINVHSTRLFLQTDAIRVSPNLWNNTYTLFLFDRQLIYCKKDLLKRTNYIYKGRIFLDNCRILNLPDGKMFGVNLKNALRIFCEQRGKWFDFCFRSASSKMRFLNTLAAERQFCGANLFVSELASGLEDDNLSDENNVLSQEYDERGIDVEPRLNNGNNEKSQESPMKQQKFNEIIAKKPRKLSKEAPPQSQIIIDYNPASTTNSLNRRRLGNWFRKSKSTNSTPSQSPTHYPLVAIATAPSIVNNSDSNSSSQSSPVNYARNKFKEPTGGGGSS